MSFKPGQSGNPGGRVKRDVLTQHLIAELNEIDAKSNVVKSRRLICQLVDKACDGDLVAIRDIYERVEGKVTQPHSGDDEAPPLQVLLQGLGEAVNAKFERIIAAQLASVEKPTE